MILPALLRDFYGARWVDSDSLRAEELNPKIEEVSRMGCIWRARSIVVALFKIQTNVQCDEVSRMQEARFRSRGLSD